MGEYIDKIKEKARSDIKTIVLPETTDKRTLIAASHIIREGIANIILVGNEEKILDGAGWLDIELDGVTIVDPHTTDRLDYYIETLLRRESAFRPQSSSSMPSTGHRSTR